MEVALLSEFRQTAFLLIELTTLLTVCNVQFTVNSASHVRHLRFKCLGCYHGGWFISRAGLRDVDQGIVSVEPLTVPSRFKENAGDRLSKHPDVLWACAGG